MEQRRTTARALVCWAGAVLVIHLSIILGFFWGIDFLAIYVTLPHVLGSLLSGTGVVVGVLVWGKPGGAIPARPRGAVAGTLLGYTGYALVGFVEPWMLMLALMGGLVATIPLVALFATLILTPRTSEEAEPAPPIKKRRVQRSRRRAT